MTETSGVPLELIVLIVSISVLVPLAYGLWVYLILRSRGAVGRSSRSGADSLEQVLRRLDRPSANYSADKS